MLYEKYDCCFSGRKGDGGEYPVQNGFGWTNGTIIWLLKKYGKILDVEFDHLQSYMNILKKLGFENDCQNSPCKEIEVQN